MTDDPRLEAVIEAVLCNNVPFSGESAAKFEARMFCAKIRAFLGENADRREVVPHNEAESVASGHNATAPAVVGADPPWLDEAADAARRHTGAPLTPWINLDESSKGHWRNIARAVLRIANAQPVSEAEVEAALRQWFPADKLGYLACNPTWRSEMRAALEAAAKVRAGG